MIDFWKDKRKTGDKKGIMLCFLSASNFSFDFFVVYIENKIHFKIVHSKYKHDAFSDAESTICLTFCLRNTHIRKYTYTYSLPLL